MHMSSIARRLSLFAALLLPIVPAHAAPGALAALDYLTGRAFLNAVVQTSTGPVNLDFNTTFDAALKSELREFVTGQLISGGLVDPLVAFSALVNSDPFIHVELTARNPYDAPLDVSFSLALPTVRLVSGEWRADASFEATLTDGNTDGASLAPRITDFDLGNTPNRFVDTGVSLLFGGLTYFGGPPVRLLGGPALVAGADASSTQSDASSAPTLPSTDWIGPDVAWNTMSLRVAFALSPGDTVTLSANYDITPVPAPIPEPGTWTLLLAGVAATAAWRGAGKARL